MATQAKLEYNRIREMFNLFLVIPKSGRQRGSGRGATLHSKGRVTALGGDRGVTAPRGGGHQAGTKHGRKGKGRCTRLLHCSFSTGSMKHGPGGDISAPQSGLSPAPSSGFMSPQPLGAPGKAPGRGTAVPRLQGTRAAMAGRLGLDEGMGLKAEGRGCFQYCLVSRHGRHLGWHRCYGEGERGHFYCHVHPPWGPCVLPPHPLLPLPPDGHRSAAQHPSSQGVQPQGGHPERRGENPKSSTELGHLPPSPARRPLWERSDPAAPLTPG